MSSYRDWSVEFLKSLFKKGLEEIVVEVVSTCNAVFMLESNGGLKNFFFQKVCFLVGYFPFQFKCLMRRSVPLRSRTDLT